MRKGREHNTEYTSSVKKSNISGNSPTIKIPTKVQPAGEWREGSFDRCNRLSTVDNWRQRASQLTVSISDSTLPKKKNASKEMIIKTRTLDIHYIIDMRISFTNPNKRCRSTCRKNHWKLSLKSHWKLVVNIMFAIIHKFYFFVHKICKFATHSEVCFIRVVIEFHTLETWLNNLVKIGPVGKIFKK